MSITSIVIAVLELTSWPHSQLEPNLNVADSSENGKLYMQKQFQRLSTLSAV